MVSIADLKERLDAIVARLSPKELVVEFVNHLLEAHECWINGDANESSRLIQQLMLRQFRDESERNLETYLYEKYPHTVGNAADLANAFASNQLNHGFDEATPVFWSQVYLHYNYGVQAAIISIPAVSTAAGAAAVQLRNVYPECAIRITNNPDRVAVLRICSGLRMLKAYYDEYKVAWDGVGIHLYANTGRGTDGTGHKDWINTMRILKLN